MPSLGRVSNLKCSDVSFATACVSRGLVLPDGQVRAGRSPPVPARRSRTNARPGAEPQQSSVFQEGSPSHSGRSGLEVSCRAHLRASGLSSQYPLSRPRAVAGSCQPRRSTGSGPWCGTPTIIRNNAAILSDPLRPDFADRRWEGLFAKGIRALPKRPPAGVPNFRERRFTRVIAGILLFRLSPSRAFSTVSALTSKVGTPRSSVERALVKRTWVNARISRGGPFSTRRRASLDRNSKGAPSTCWRSALCRRSGS